MQPYRIWLSPPHMCGKEKEFVDEAFATNWISPAGPHLSAFENELAAALGGTHQVAALSSGTAAMHLALIIMGIGKGDEVLCQSFTFAGSCNPVVYVGATPVFVDSERDTWNMDPDLLEEAIIDRLKKTGKKPRAIVVVHLYGMPAKWAELKAVADRYEIPIIEDAAEALGSTYQGKPAGTLGVWGILSFNGNKIITTSGGGALVASEGALIQKARFLATQARDPAPHYQHTEIGYNYRLSNVCAGIGRGQLTVLADRVRTRRRIFDHYEAAFRNVLEIKLLVEPKDVTSNRWLTTLLIDSQKVTREDVRQRLDAERIETRPLWKPMHLQPVFRDCPAYLNGVSGALFEHGLCLPSGSALSLLELEEISGKVRGILGY